MSTTRPPHEPVFMDRTGRRRRLFALAGAAGGLVLVLAALALLAGLTGAGPAAVPGWPAAERVEHPRSARTPAASTTAAPATTAPPARRSIPPPARPSPTATAPAATSPAATSPSASAGFTPPGHLRTHRPNPHASKKL